ncbi:uncharacterized protein LOC132197335 isoform X2 [Neocloeon triangulifer]|uniref:uncharacterized protein LOC132197335 isoform X2 n=1 Tax=Neocloeon triangulifer TaxID=2078957 RepID=UPI00286ED620|nr:uncharacterized protein LOC132197335 isoform X2 [Neocloeon triangulifer]
MAQFYTLIFSLTLIWVMMPHNNDAADEKKSKVKIQAYSGNLANGRIQQINLNGKNMVSLKGKKKSAGLQPSAIIRRSHIQKCCASRSCSNEQNSKNRQNQTKIAEAQDLVVRTDFNGPSQKLVKIGTKKYKFPKEKATFEGAKKFCADQNMALSTFDDPGEVKKISEYLNYIGLADDPIYTSISSALGSSSSSSVNWGTDSPPGGSGDCVVQKDGVFYNASCDSLSNFACEEKPLPPGVTEAIGADALSSIGDAVLNFVGGKNIVVPSEKATAKQAESICAGQGLSLMSLDSLAQMDSVKDFLGDIGLSSTTVLTSMKKVTDGNSNWLGDLASALVPPKDPAQAGDCMGLNSLGLTGVTCDMVSNFVCEAPSPNSAGPTQKASSGTTSSNLDPMTDSPAVEPITQASATLAPSDSSSVNSAGSTPNSAAASSAVASGTGTSSGVQASATNTLPSSGTTETQTSVSADSTTGGQTATTSTVDSTTTSVGASGGSTDTSLSAQSSSTSVTSGSIPASASGASTMIGSTPTPTSPMPSTSLPSSSTTSVTSTTTRTSTITSTTTSTTTTTSPSLASGSFTYGSKTYIVSTELISSNNASAWCVAKGYKLYCPKNSGEFNNIKTTLQTAAVKTALNYDGVSNLGIGLRKNTAWGWTDGQGFNKNDINWSEDLPAITGNCGVLNPAYVWARIVDCAIPTRIICEP